MKNNKKLLAVLSVPAIASLLAVAVTTPVKAADRDFTDNSVSPAITYSYDDYTSSDEKFDSLVNAVYAHPSNFLYEMGGKHYQYSAFVDTYSAAKKTGVTAAQAYKIALDTTPVVTLVNVTSVDTVKDVTVDNGTTADKLGLPTTVAVTLSDGTKDAANVAWDTTKFDGTKAGDQTITGTLTAPAGKAWTLTDAQKTVNVKVTVKAAVSAVSSVSAITTTSTTVVLADKPAAALATSDFTVKANGSAVAVNKVEKVDSDLTGKTYKLTIASINGTQGTLNVNGVEKAFDFKAPEVVSVTAKGTKTLEVVFSEAIKDTTAIGANFNVTKVVGNTPVGTGTVALSADGTKATVSLNSGLTVADYVLKLGVTDTETAINRVKDVAGNSIYGGTEISFRPTADQLSVKEAASITTAQYNNGTGVVKVTFNKNVTATNVDATKLTLGGVALTSSDVVAQDVDSNGAISNAVTITLSADTKKAVNAVTGALNLVGTASAWTDDSTLATDGQTVAVTKVTPAVVSSASYNQETKVLTVNFDQPVKINNLDNIKVYGSATGATAAGATNPDGTPLDKTVAKSTWTLKLASGQASALETTANDKTKLVVYLDVDAVRNDSTTVISNVPTTSTNGGVTLAYTADTTKPYATGVVYDNRTQKLQVTFSEALSSISIGNIKIATAATGDSNSFDLSNYTMFAGLDDSGKVLTVTLNPTDASKLDSEYLTGNTIKAYFAKEVFTDVNGLKNDALTFDSGIALTYHDFVAPKVDVVNTNTLNQTYVKVTFNEQVDKATAEAASNYVIKDLSGNTLAVNSAVLQADKKTVYLNTAAQESGKPYSLVVNNVRDLQQNLINTDYNSKTFYGNSQTAAAKLGVVSVTAAAPVNSKNDTLAVVFDGAVNQTQALNLANYAVLEASGNTDNDWAAAKAVSLSDAKADIDTTGKNVTITLGSYNLQSGKYYKVVASNITDVFGNALDSAKTTVVSSALVAENLTVPSLVETNTKTGAVVLTFNQELNATEAAKAANYKVAGNTVSKATYAWDATKNNGNGQATVTLDLATALTASATSTGTKDVQISNAVTNLAGVTINGLTYDFATIGAPTSLTDNVAPTVDTVKANINSGVADDTIVITFKDNDILKAIAENKATYVVKDASGNVIPAADYTVTMTDGTVADKATITFDKTGDNAYNLQANGTYTVTIAGIMDESGNAMDTVTKTADLVNDYSAGVTTTAQLNGNPLRATADNVFDIESTTTTLGDIELAFAKSTSNVAIKKSSTSDFAVRVYDANGQVTLTDAKNSLIKTLLFGQLDTSNGVAANVVKANIAMSYAQLKTAANNLTGTTVTSVQIDAFDLAGNKTTVTLNLK